MRDGGSKEEIEAFPAFNWPEPAGFGVEKVFEEGREGGGFACGGGGGGEGGGGLPLVMENDVDFLINIFAAEGAT
jgi:hypothetical protein